MIAEMYTQTNNPYVIQSQFASNNKAIYNDYIVALQLNLINSTVIIQQHDQ